MNAVDRSILAEDRPTHGSANSFPQDDWPAHVRPSPDRSIRVAATAAEIDAIGRLRYELYVARDGKAYAHADHEQRLLLDPVDDASLNFYASFDDRVLAAVRLTRAEDALSDPQMAMLVKASGIKRLRDVFVCSRFVAEPCPSARRTIVPMLQQVYATGLSAGANVSLLATRRRLKGIFAKFGYRSAGWSFDDPIAGLMHVLSLNLYDIDHLASVESPLLSVLTERFQKYNDDVDA